MVKERHPALILTFDDLKDILRTLFAAVLQPELDDLRDARLEKLHVIPDELILKMGPGKVLVIGDDLVLVIIAQLEIGLVEDLVLLDVAEQLQIVMAVETVGDLLPVQLGHRGLQLIPYGVGQPVDVRIVGVEGSPVQSGPLTNVGYADLCQRPGLQQLNKNLLDPLHGLAFSPVVGRIHASSFNPTLVVKLVIVFPSQLHYTGSTRKQQLLF